MLAAGSAAWVDAVVIAVFLAAGLSLSAALLFSFVRPRAAARRSAAGPVLELRTAGKSVVAVFAAAFAVEAIAFLSVDLFWILLALGVFVTGIALHAFAPRTAVAEADGTLRVEGGSAAAGTTLARARLESDGRRVFRVKLVLVGTDGTTTSVSLMKSRGDVLWWPTRVVRSWFLGPALVWLVARDVELELEPGVTLLGHSGAESLGRIRKLVGA